MAKSSSVEWPCPAKLPSYVQAPALRGEAKQWQNVVIRGSSKQNQATVLSRPGEPERSLIMNQGF